VNVKARITLTLAIGICLCAACQQSATPSPASPTPTKLPTATPQLDPEIEEYAVYAAVLEGTFIRDDTKQVLIMDHTQTQEPVIMESFLADFQKNTPLASEVVASFKERNQQSHPLEPVLDLEVEYQLLTQEEVDEFRLQDEASGWKLFYEKYPDTVGLIHLSRVGFNADLSHALVYIAHYHYQQPLLGGYYLMVRRDGRWEVESGLEWIT
jgi:hypothetical protein